MQRHGRAPALADHAEQAVGGPLAGGGDVGVGREVVAEDGVGQVEPVGVDVGVVVECDRDWGVSPDHGADALQDFAVGVEPGGGGHAAVEGEQDAV